MAGGPRGGASALLDVRLDQPGRTVLAFGVIGTLAACALELANVRNSWLALEDISAVLAPASGAAAVAVAAVRAEPEHRRVRLWIAISLGITALGQLLAALPDLLPGLTSSGWAVLTDVCYVSGAVLGIATLMRAVYRRLEGDSRREVMLDGLIIMCAAVALVMTNWLMRTVLPGWQVAPLFADPTPNLLVPMVSASFFASAAAAMVAAFALRVEPAPRGVWAVAAGIMLISMAWVGWIGRFLSGTPDSIEPMDVIFPIGTLVTAWGGLTWSLRPGGGRLYGRIADATANWLPMVAIVGCAMLDVLPRHRPLVVDPVAAATCVVVFLAVIRQRGLQGKERTASERLTTELSERAATAFSLARLEAGTTVEETAERICAEALLIGGIDTVTVMAFTASTVVPLAQGGPPTRPVEVGEPIPEGPARELREHADFGLWLESWTDVLPRDEFNGAVAASGLRAEALAPLVWNDETIGLLALGATTSLNARHLGDRLPTLTEFSVMSAAVLGPMLSARSQLERVRSEVQSVIDSHSFWPVFQPIVDLATREWVGYEALTRFSDGTRPDLRFLAADKVGMMVRLETACLDEQIARARHLPKGGFLSLNVSPALATELNPLIDVLERADRPVVLEVTEHMEIQDYPKLMAALDSLRGRVRLAVDDAGAGYAGLHHILELRPQFVKLDISLVRNVDVDPARQAMVTGMAHFAESVGCDLIAEGIETANEMAAIRLLGVRYGQGYFLGKPAPVAAKAAAKPEARAAAKAAATHRSNARKRTGEMALARPARSR